MMKCPYCKKETIFYAHGTKEVEMEILSIDIEGQMTYGSLEHIEEELPDVEFLRCSECKERFSEFEFAMTNTCIEELEISPCICGDDPIFLDWNDDGNIWYMSCDNENCFVGFNPRPKNKKDLILEWNEYIKNKENLK